MTTRAQAGAVCPHAGTPAPMPFIRHIVFAPDLISPRNAAWLLCCFAELGHIRQQSRHASLEPHSPCRSQPWSPRQSLRRSLAHGHPGRASLFPAISSPAMNARPPRRKGRQRTGQNLNPSDAPCDGRRAKMSKSMRTDSARIFPAAVSPARLSTIKATKYRSFAAAYREHVAREAKRLIAVDTPVVAFFEKEYWIRQRWQSRKSINSQADTIILRYHIWRQSHFSQKLD